MLNKFITTKNLSAKPELLAKRFNDLKQRLLKNKKYSKTTGLITIRLSESEFESVIDMAERLQKYVFLEEENRKLKKEITKLDKKLDDKAFNELIAIEWAKKAIPENRAELKHFKEAAYRIGVKRPKRGRPVEHNPKDEVEFWEMAYNLIEGEQGSPPTTKQRKNIIEKVKVQFGHLSYVATCQYLSEQGVKHLSWPSKSKAQGNSA